MSLFMVPELELRGKEWPSLGPYVCKWIEDHLVFGPGDLLGEPAKLDDEKRFLIWRAYEIYPPGHEQAGRRRFQRVALSLRKGSAKTEFMAWIAAAEIGRDAPVRCDGFRKDGTPIVRAVRNPYIPLLAYTEQQSEELAYGGLREILTRSRIADQFDIGLERIIRIGRGGQADGKVEAVAGMPSARDGARTTFQGFDETHRFITPRLRRAHQTMLQNLPKRRHSDAWSLETTTAYAPGEYSIAESTHNYAKHVAEGRMRDSRLFFYHRQAADGYDLELRDDRKRAVIEASGPVASWSSIDVIVDQYEDPDCDRTYWERVWLNRPTKSADQAFSAKRWAELADGKHKVAKGARITIGFDGARYHDATAAIATEIETGFQFPLGIWERPAGLEEWEVPQGEVEDTIEHAFKTYKVVRMYADPPYWETVVAVWAGKYGDKVVALFLTSRYRRMADACRGYANAIADGHLRHDGNQAFARHVGNAQKRPLNYNDEQGQALYVLSKASPQSPAKIDAAVAAVLSWQARTDVLASGEGVKRPSIYQQRGLLTV